MARLSSKTVILWVDVETTGIDPTKEDILEIAYGFQPAGGTDRKYMPEFYSELVIPQTVLDEAELNGTSVSEEFESLVNGLDKYVLNMHTETHLLTELRKLIADHEGDAVALRAYTMSGVLERLQERLDRITQPNQYGYYDIAVAGNSPHFDRSFLEARGRKDHPVIKSFSHQQIDVSVLIMTSNIASNSWDAETGHQTYPQVETPEGGVAHRALYDIIRCHHTWQHFWEIMEK